MVRNATSLVDQMHAHQTGLEVAKLARWVVRICALCAAFLSLAAFGASADHQGEPKVTLYYSTWGPQTEARQATLDAFHKAYPHIEVKYLPRSEAPEHLLLQLMASEPPDVFDLPYHLGIDGVYMTGFVRPIDDLVARDGFDLDRFIPHTLHFARFEGSLMGFPRSDISSALGTQMPVYNRRMFDEAGLEYPAADWTFADYLAKAQKLTRREGDGTVTQWGVSGGSIGGFWYTWVWSAGGELVSEDGQRALLLSPEAVEGLQFTVDLDLQYGVKPPYPQDVSFWEQKAAIKAHESTTWALSDGRFAYPDLDWAYAPMPRGPNSDSGYGLLGSHVTAISANTPHVEEAWTFLKFLSSAEYQEYEYYEIKRGTPHLMELVYTPRFLEFDSPPWSLEPVLNAKAKPVPRTLAWSEFDLGVRQAFRVALLGEADIRTAMEGHIDRLNAILQSAGQ